MAATAGLGKYSTGGYGRIGVYRVKGRQAVFVHSEAHLQTLKPIFHCDAKPFALGTYVGLDPQPHNFALGIPTCWHLKTRKFMLPPAPTTNASTYRWRWVPNTRGSHWPCRFHAVCLVFGRVGYPTQTGYPVEYRLKKSKCLFYQNKHI